MRSPLATVTSLVAGLLCSLLACSSAVKNEDGAVVEPGTEIRDAGAETHDGDATAASAKTDREAPIGNYVGSFVPAGEPARIEVGGEEWTVWNRINKISIAIDSLTRDSAFGHSVVAGNLRPFRGTYREPHTGRLRFDVREPGDDRYDGRFEFDWHRRGIEGTWIAFGDVEIAKRTFELPRRAFVYDPKITLERSRRYIDWRDGGRDERFVGELDGEAYEWIEETFATATDAIYELNASADTLTVATVENLKRGDLRVLRNTVYARHGYSFRERPLRIFFDAQSWYVPVRADIRADFTPLEITNIELLLRYKQNAAEYYDRFGRG